MNQKVAAIVPAYNEEKWIKPVLEVLTSTSEINEIIVVDDGSRDGTSSVARSVSGVQVLVNNRNLGKSYSLDRGVMHTDADILFFCDADLKDFSKEIVSEILRPVISGERDMFIGARNNVAQKAVTLFALNSGERALKREIWTKLPDLFKHRYRLEPGLNMVAEKYGNGFEWKRFPYYQRFKEVKYGFFKGTILRWWMNFDILCAYMAAPSAVKSFKKKK